MAGRFARLTGWQEGNGWRDRLRRAGAEQRGYRPSQCRTAGCTLDYEHTGRCEGPRRQPLTVRLPRLDHRDGGIYWGNPGYEQPDSRVGTNHRRLHHPRRRGQTAPIVRENMRRTRAHQPIVVRVSR